MTETWGKVKKKLVSIKPDRIYYCSLVMVGQGSSLVFGLDVLSVLSKVKGVGFPVCIRQVVRGFPDDTSGEISCHFQC